MSQVISTSDQSGVIYSICICNYNMEGTIEQSLTSLLSQLDSRFEVVVVDDGSTDESTKIVEKMQHSFSNLRLVPLLRDSKRKLGYTRNISIKEAYGEYVLLHLDCDDIFGPYVSDFVNVFHMIENCIGQDILLSGQHINMARRNFLLSHGPFLNIYRGEDRNLWSRMAAINAWIPLDHFDFITRLPKTRRLRLKKNFVDTFDHMRNDFRSGVPLKKYFFYEIKKRNLYSMKLFIFRLSMLIPSWFLAYFTESIPQHKTIGSPEAFASYRAQTRGTFSEIMKRYGGDPSLAFLSSKEAEQIFASKGEKV